MVTASQLMSKKSFGECNFFSYRQTHVDRFDKAGRSQQFV